MSETKLELNFMVEPQELKEKAYVRDGIRVKIVDILGMKEQKLLGESGLRMAERGFTFIFQGDIAQKLLEKGIATKVIKNNLYFD